MMLVLRQEERSWNSSLGPSKFEKMKRILRKHVVCVRNVVEELRSWVVATQWFAVEIGMVGTINRDVVRIFLFTEIEN